MPLADSTYTTPTLPHPPPAQPLLDQHNSDDQCNHPATSYTSDSRCHTPTRYRYDAFDDDFDFDDDEPGPPARMTEKRYLNGKHVLTNMEIT